MSQERRLSPWWGTAVVAAVLAIGLSTGAYALGGPPPTATPPCTGAQLQLKYLSSQGAAGRRGWEFAFKNTGSTCTMHGYARVVLLGKHGHRIPAHIRRASGFTPKTVILAHGKRAFFTFLYADGGFCAGPAFDAYRFRLFAPGAAHGTTFNPLPPSHGLVPSVCKGSERMFPVRATKALAARDVSAAATPICAPALLRLEVTGRQAFTSHRVINFALRNMSPTTCHLKGYPGIGLLDAHAQLLSVGVNRHGPHSTSAVVLGTYHRAFFSFVYAVAGPCLPQFFTFYGLQVIPPGTSHGLRWFAGRIDACPGHPTVSPVSAHP